MRETPNHPEQGGQEMKKEKIGEEEWYVPGKYSKHEAPDGTNVHVDGKWYNFTAESIVDEGDDIRITAVSPCTREALKKTMEKMANEYKKTIRCSWNEDEIVHEPS
jgi:hypothetical protein